MTKLEVILLGDVERTFYIKNVDIKATGNLFQNSLWLAFFHEDAYLSKLEQVS